MNERIIHNHNERVKPGDTVFHIGDFCFKNSAGGKAGEGMRVNAQEWVKRLNGNIIFIKGNHDKNNSCKTCIEYLVIGFGGERIKLVHNPEHVGYEYVYNFVGHVHQNWKFMKFESKGKSTVAFNVGVDVNNFRPVCYGELMEGFTKWKLRKEAP